MADSDADVVARYRGVELAFGTHRVLRGVDLRLPRGQTTVILGPSGAGKSVMLKLLVGLLTPDQGQMEVFGQDLATCSEPQLFGIRRRMGMMFQDGALFDSMTVGENVAFPLERHSRLSRAEIAEQVAFRLEQVGLPGIEQKMPSDLSGGMRKRVSLARAIITEPEIVLFDEPNSGLDPVTSDEVDQLIIDTRERLGVTFVVISHDIVGAFRVADRLAMLHQGRILIDGTPEELRCSPDPIVRRFLARNLELPPLPAAGGPT